MDKAREEDRTSIKYIMCNINITYFEGWRIPRGRCRTLTAAQGGPRAHARQRRARARELGRPGRSSESVVRDSDGRKGRQAGRLRYQSRRGRRGELRLAVAAEHGAWKE